MEVFVAVGRTYTTVSIGDVVEKYLCRTVKQQPVAGCAQSPCQQAGLAQPVADFFGKIVDHSRGYVRGQAHTQGIENFWSLLKRTLRGTYVAGEPFHLDRYLDE